jgi:hypothetical protein
VIKSRGIPVGHDLVIKLGTPLTSITRSPDHLITAFPQPICELDRNLAGCAFELD